MTHVLPRERSARVPGEAAAEALFRARAAQQQWQRFPVRERAARLRILRRGLLARINDIIETVNAEVGKPRVEGLVHEVGVTAALLRNLERTAPALLRARGVGGWPFVYKRGERWLEPFGVIGVISPANFPFMLAAIPTFSALAAGNGIVLKPSERAPRTARLLGSLVREAIPELQDLLMLLQGDWEAGAALIENAPDKVVFIGGVESGRRVAAAAAARLIPAVLELGANDAAIVCEDADVDRAAAALVWGATANTGQVCMSMQRALVHERLYDRFLQRARLEMERIRTPADVGALQAGGQLSVIRELLDDAVARGARVLTGGTAARDAPPVFPPTLIADVDEESALHRQEIFGPVLAVTPVADDDEAVRIANDSPFGLNASVWSSSAARATALAQRLRAGAVVINDVLSNMGMDLPYGGVNASGFGRLLGPEGLLEFVRTKSVVTMRVAPARELYWHPYTDRRYALLRRLTGAAYDVGLGRRLAALLRRQ